MVEDLVVGFRHWLLRLNWVNHQLWFLIKLQLQSQSKIRNRIFLLQISTLAKEVVMPGSSSFNKIKIHQPQLETHLLQLVKEPAPIMQVLDLGLTSSLF